jgi:hypothetical protein
MSNQNQIIGTIISSVLKFEDLCIEVGEPTTFNKSSSTYAPCDGRSIDTSKLYQRNNQFALAPDLRGKFIRGLNHFPNTNEPAFDVEFGDKDGEIARRQVLQYQEDEMKSHAHSARGHINGSVSGSNGTRDCDEGTDKLNSDPKYGDREVVIILDNHGGSETRPKNVAVFFYIKIN